MELIIDSTGQASCIYGETLNLAELGQLSIQRASHVEPDAQGRWYADLRPVQGPTLGPFAHRSEALAAEVAWLSEHWLSNLRPS
jgi:hypothetical protein